MKKTGALVVLAGDYNVVQREFDIYEKHSYGTDALLQPEIRKAYQRLLSQGWTDSLRALHPDDRFYTYWSYLRNRWPRDAGLRLDHILLSPDLAKMLQEAALSALSGIFQRRDAGRV